MVGASRWRDALLACVLLAAAGACPASDIAARLQAYAPSAAAAIDCAQASPTTQAAAQLQYLAPVRALLAWREWTGPAGPCVQLDWPQSVLLSGAARAGLQVLLEEESARRRQLLTPALPQAQVLRGEQRQAQPVWRPLAWVQAPEARPSLPLCPRLPPLTQVHPVELPIDLAATVLRVRPHRCRPGGLPMAGSGVLLAPQLALTAAHVLMTPSGLVCDRYRVVPGGRRYTDPPAAPYGMGFVSRAVLSERGGWQVAAGVAPPPNQNYDARTAHDYALLLLETPASVPASTLWPRLRFGGAPAALAQPLLMAGYGTATPTGRAAPGALVSIWGQTACVRGVESFARQALWMSAGASGGPIWHWAPERPLELATLGVRMEVIGADHFESLGPRFDLQDYWQLLATLRAEAPSN